MGRTAGKKQAPAKVEDDDDAEGWDDAVVETDGKESEADLRLRDWRDVERYREMKELRGLVDDDYGLEEIFHVPIKPRLVVPKGRPMPVKAGAAAKAAASAKGAAPVAAAKPGKPVPVAAKPAAATPAAKPAKAEKAPPSKAQVKAAPTRKAPPAKLKAKAKKK